MVLIQERQKKALDVLQVRRLIAPAVARDFDMPQCVVVVRMKCEPRIGNHLEIHDDATAIAEIWGSLSFRQVSSSSSVFGDEFTTLSPC